MAEPSVTPDGRLAIPAIDKPKAALSSTSAVWKAIGPDQIATSAYGNVTGRISSIAVDPADSTGNTVFLGTTGGGVWKSTNAAGPRDAVYFVPLTDSLPVYSGNAGTSVVPSLSIGALSVQPGGGLGEVILAGTGDPNDATDSYYGSGILRSVDGGSTWTLTQGSHDGVYGNHYFIGLGMAGFAWSTVSPDLVVAAVSESAEGTLVNASSAGNSVAGLYYSADAGATWHMATIFDGPRLVQTPLLAGGNGVGNAATAVVWNPVRKVFVAAIRFHGFYQSSDGISWTRLAQQPGTGLTTTVCPANPNSVGSPNCPIFRGALAVQPATGDTFALTVDSNNLDHGLWQDVCGSSGVGCAGDISFATQIDSTPLEMGSGSTAIFQGEYDLALAAAPATAGDSTHSVLYAGTVDLFRCDLSQGNSCLLRNTTNSLNGCGAPAGVAPAQHAIATIALAQPLVYLGNDGGLWRSTDGVSETGTACSAGDATHFQNLNSGIGSLAESVSLASHPTDPDTLLLGVGANGTALTSSASGLQPWIQVAAGEGGTVAIDQSDPADMFVSTGPGVSLKACAKGSGCTADDFSGQPTIGPAQVSGDASVVDPPFLLDPRMTTDVLIGTCRVWRGPASDGAAWSAANALAEPFGGPANSTCSSSTNPLVRSMAAGGSLNNAGVSPNAGSTVIYAGMAGSLDGGGNLGGHVFVTTSGATAGPDSMWDDVAGNNVSNDVANAGKFNPGGFDVSSVIADSHDPTGRTVYATVMGFAGNGISAPHLYRTLDGGGHWSNLSGNLPNVPASSVAVDPNDANTVYVATDAGVYATSEIATCSTANCWNVYGAGLPNAPVIQLVASIGLATGDGRTGELRAATYGRGVWQIPLLTAVSPAAPGITLDATALTFGAQTVATESAAQSITVTNGGDAALTVSSITAMGDFTENDTCVGVAIAPGASCMVAVRFLPSAVGTRSGVLTVYGNVAGGQATASLAGTGTTAAAIVLNPIAVSFPNLSTGTMSAPINITISNTGGTASGLQTPTVNGADFALSANTCGTTLASQTGCTVSIVFRPSASGVRSGTFSITDDAGIQTASLTGTATSPATDGLSPLSLSFGPQVLNTTSAAQTVTLTNDGDVALTLISAERSVGDFTVVNACGNSLNDHTHCMIAVAFVPKSVGAIAGTLTVSDQFRSQTVMLSGSGLAPAGVSLSPSAGIAFAATAVGASSASQTVTLTNNGGVALGVQGIAVSGDFAVMSGSNSCGSSLAAGTACTLQLAFMPTVGGPRTGSLVFTDSAANSPQTLTLTGVGVDFALTSNGPASVTVASGTSAVFPLLLTSASGTPGSASFTCLGAPLNARCNVTPQDPALGATTAVAVTLATGVSSASAVGSLGGSGRTGFWLAGVLALGLAGFRRVRILRACLLIGLGTLLGCSAGRLIPASGGSGGTSPPAGVVTPSGSYSIAVSATSAGLTRTVNLTLVVQ